MLYVPIYEHFVIIFSDNCVNFVYTEPSDNLMHMVADVDDSMDLLPRAVSPDNIPSLPEIDYSEGEDPDPLMYQSEIQDETIDQCLNPPSFFGVRYSSNEIVGNCMASSSYGDDQIDDTAVREFLSQDNAPSATSFSVMRPKQRVFLSARDALVAGESRESFADVLARDEIPGPVMQIQLRDETPGPVMQIQLRDMLLARGALTGGEGHSESVAAIPASFKFAIGDRVVSKNTRCDGMYPGIITGKDVQENLPTYTVIFLDNESDVGVAEHHMFKMSDGCAAIIPPVSIMHPLHQLNSKRVSQKSSISK